MKIRLESSDLKFTALYNQICDEQEASLQRWIADLRDAGFKAAHPNDGWVNHETNEMHFAYAHFNDGVEIGSTVMLGQPWDRATWHPVRLIGKRVTTLGRMEWWQFEEFTWNGKEKS